MKQNYETYWESATNADYSPQNSLSHPPHFTEWLPSCHISPAHLLFPSPSHPPTWQCVTRTTSKHSSKLNAYAAGARGLMLIHVHFPRRCACSADVSATFPSWLPHWLADPQPTSWHLRRTRQGATHAHKAPHTSERGRSGLHETLVCVRERERVLSYRGTGERHFSKRRPFRQASLW